MTITGFPQYPPSITGFGMPPNLFPMVAYPITAPAATSTAIVPSNILSLNRATLYGGPTPRLSGFPGIYSGTTQRDSLHGRQGTSHQAWKVGTAKANKNGHPIPAGQSTCQVTGFPYRAPIPPGPIHQPQLPCLGQQGSTTNLMGPLKPLPMSPQNNTPFPWGS